MKKIGFLLLIFFSFFVHSESIEVEYASFYSHVKKLQGDDTKALRFAFGFQHIAESRLCKLTDAKIVTEKQTLPLVVEANNRFTVPTDKILKMAKALVLIEMEDQANQCDMSVQLETQPEYLKQGYTKQELEFLFDQYQAFFDEMGGFLSFMMPEAEGLVLHFAAGVIFPESLKNFISDNKLSLHQSQINQLKGLELTESPLRITALLEK